MSHVPLASSAFADSFEDPIEASPAKILRPALVQPKQDMVGAALFFVAGLGLSIFFLLSNVCALMDLYCGGLEIKHRIVPSPWLSLSSAISIKSLCMACCL